MGAVCSLLSPVCSLLSASDSGGVSVHGLAGVVLVGLFSGVVGTELSWWPLSNGYGVRDGYGVREQRLWC